MSYRPGDVRFSRFNEGAYLVVRVNVPRRECDLLVLNAVLDETQGGVQRCVDFAHLDVTTKAFPRANDGAGNR